MAKTVEERLLSRIIKTNGCWEWQGALTRDGYGRIAITGSSKRGRCHRVSYEMFIGPIAEGLCVCHTCDNRKCINPTHLFLGTIQDNTKDMCQKMRNRGAHKGIGHHKAKLNNEQIAHIRELYSAGSYTQREIAGMFDTCQQHISSIVTKQSWSHL